MSQVVIRGESVYTCDVCNRKMRAPTNRHGLDVVQRCTITSGCQGKLHRVTSSKEVNSTPVFPPEVEGLQDWFARNILYTHIQPVRVATWTVKHNMQNVPVLHTFVYRTVDGVDTLVDFEPTDVTIVDANTLVIKFSAPESGQVQCVSSSTKNTLNFNGLAPIAANTTAIELTSTTGELTIATTNLAAEVSVRVTYMTSTPISVTYTLIDNVASLDSPWVGASYAFVNGKKYVVRSFNPMTHADALSYFTNAIISSGTAFRIDQINGVDIAANEVIILLSKPPHTTVDRIFNQYVESKSVSNTLPETFYSNNSLYTTPSIVRTTYPLIFVV